MSKGSMHPLQEDTESDVEDNDLLKAALEYFCEGNPTLDLSESDGDGSDPDDDDDSLSHSPKDLFCVGRQDELPI